MNQLRDKVGNQSQIKIVENKVRADGKKVCLIKIKKRQPPKQEPNTQQGEMRFNNFVFNAQPTNEKQFNSAQNSHATYLNKLAAKNYQQLRGGMMPSLSQFNSQTSSQAT